MADQNTWTHEGVTYTAAEPPKPGTPGAGHICFGCAAYTGQFRHDRLLCSLLPPCDKSEREDGRTVVFVRQEEVRPMPKLLKADTGEALSGFGRLDFIRETVSEYGGIAFAVPPWWNGGHTYYAMKSVTGFDIDGWACDGKCDACPIAADCAACDTCQLCAWWTSKTGRKGTCEDPAYGGTRKRRTRADGTCSQFMSRWATFDALNEMDRRVPVETVRIHAAAAESGAGAFSPEVSHA